MSVHDPSIVKLEEGADGTNIRQWSNNGGDHQEWRLIEQDNSYCKIVSMADESKCVTVDGNDATDGLNISLKSY